MNTITITERIAELNTEKDNLVNEKADWKTSTQPIPSIFGTREQLIIQYSANIAAVQKKIDAEEANLEKTKAANIAQSKIDAKHKAIFNQIYKDIATSGLSVAREGDTSIKVNLTDNVEAKIQLDYYYSGGGTWGGGTRKNRVEMRFDYKAKEKDGRYTIKKDGTVNTTTMIKRMKEVDERLTNWIEHAKSAKIKKQTELAQLNAMIPADWEIVERSTYHRGNERYGNGGYTEKYLVVVPKDEEKKGISFRVSKNTDDTWNITKTVVQNKITEEEAWAVFTAL